MKIVIDRDRDSYERELKQLRADNEQLRLRLKVAELKAASSLANNLCSDHRDKQKGKPCLACEIEHLQRLATAPTSPARE